MAKSSAPGSKACPPPPPRGSAASQSTDEEETRGRKAPLEVPHVDLKGNIDGLLEWFAIVTEFYAKRKCVWPKGAGISLLGVSNELRSRWLSQLESQSSKDSEILKLSLEVASLRAELEKSKHAVSAASTESSCCISTPGRKKRRASEDIEILRSTAEGDAASSTDNLLCIGDAVATTTTTTGSMTTGGWRVQRNARRVAQAPSSSSRGNVPVGGNARKRSSSRQRAASRASVSRSTDTGNQDGTILCLSYKSKVQPNGHWETLTENEFKELASKASSLLSELRVTKTIAIGGGVGLILPNRDQWNAAIAAVSTDTTLVVKEVPKKTLTVKIMYPSGQDVRDILMKDLASKNNVDTTRLSIVCNRDRYAIIKGPVETLKAVASSGRVFLGLCSCRAIKLSKKGGLCYKCGKYHQLKGLTDCPFEVECARCGGQHALEVCAFPRFYKGPRKCSNCHGAHSAVEHCCKPVWHTIPTGNTGVTGSDVTDNITQDINLAVDSATLVADVDEGVN